MNWLNRLADRLARRSLPADFRGELGVDENVLAVAGSLVATSQGLWAGERRMPWHLISKAIWRDGVLTVIEASEVDTAGRAVLLKDAAPQRFSLSAAGKLPEVVHRRVTRSIKSSHHRELGGGGAWFVQRAAPGGGVVLQVRSDPGTDPEVLRTAAAEVAEALHSATQS